MGKEKMRKRIFFKLFIALILLGIVSFLLAYRADQQSVNIINQYHHQAKGRLEIEIGKKKYKLFEAVSEVEKSLGLSVFDQINSDEGMIFYFDKPAYHSMYMKDMKFDIDIIFLDQGFKVITIHENVSVSSYRSQNDFEIFKSYSPSKYVIELSAGEVEKNKLKVGDVIKTLENY